MVFAPYNKKLIWLLITALSILHISTALALESNISPEQIKALYLVQIRKFVQVDNPPRAIHEICYYEKPDVAEDESVGQILIKYLQKNNVPSSQVSVKWLQAIRDFSGCDMLYIPAHEDANIDEILSKIGSMPILTVSPAKRFIYRGGMIGMVLDDANHIKLEANAKNMTNNSISADAQLLEIMQQVVRQ